MSKLQTIKASLASHIVRGTSDAVLEAALAGFILFEQGNTQFGKETFQLGGVTPQNLGETRAILKANNCMFFFTDEPPSIMIYPPK